MIRGRAATEDLAERAATFTKNKKQFKKCRKVVKNMQNKGIGKDSKTSQDFWQCFKDFFSNEGNY